MKDITKARLAAKSPLTSEVSTFTFETIEEPFRGLTAGAHIDVHLGRDLIRNYSLTEWDTAGRWFSVAVKWEPHGRGGSTAMHRLEAGDVLEIGGPRNNFALRSTGEPLVLIGAGIGITPVYAMARELASEGCGFELHHVARTRALAAFHPEIENLRLGEKYILHCTEEQGRPDFSALLESHPEDAHYYVCGPEPLLTAISDASRMTGRGTVVFERFAAAGTVTPDAEDSAFHVVLASTGDELEVPAEKSILQVLREAGREVDYSCSEGICGSCITDVLEGEIDHRDSILSDEEKAAGDCLCVCVSRARCPRLVLDL